MFFGGKGGVGKSTLSCATALKLSQWGRTLLVSVDPAHSLTGILGIEVGQGVKAVGESLFAVELSAEGLVEKYAEKVLRVLEGLIPSSRQGFKEYSKYLKSSPTALETAVLDWLADLCKDYVYLVVDSAPTGQMLRLFQTAHMVGGWLEFLTKLVKERERVERFMGRKDSLLSLLEEKKRKIQTLSWIFRKKTLIFAVANEEELSLEEARILEKKLEGFNVYTLINRWSAMEWKGPKVPLANKPYGVENLLQLDIGDILKLLVDEGEKPLS